MNKIYKTLLLSLPLDATMVDTRDIEALRFAIGHQNRDEILVCLEGEHPADIADIFEQLSVDDRLSVWLVWRQMFSVLPFWQSLKTRWWKMFCLLLRTRAD